MGWRPPTISQRSIGIRNVAVLDKGWLGGGNTGRNTTIIRSNYLQDESAALYEHALKLWEGLAQALNYNVMYSPRGVLMLAHNASRRAGVPAPRACQPAAGHRQRVADAGAGEGVLSAAGYRANVRYPVLGAALQRRGGVARHDAVAWGYARAASALGVDIIQNCEVTGIVRDASGAVTGVETNRGPIAAGRIGVVGGRPHQRGDGDGRRAHAAGIVSAAGAGERAGEAGAALRGDVEHHPRLHLAIRQRRTGDRRRHGCLHVLQPGRRAAHRCETLEAICELFPSFRRLRMLRNWGGIVDVTPDRSPIIGLTPVPGLFVNCGWGTGGFKATPGSGHVFAATIARGEPHPIAAPFSLDRFAAGRLIDEAAAAAVAH